MNDIRERLVREALASDASDNFAPGFADRAAARWRADRVGALPQSMDRQFRRLVPFAIAASLLLATVSLISRDPASQQSVAQAVLGWRPSVDEPSMMSLELLYDLQAPSLAPR